MSSQHPFWICFSLIYSFHILLATFFSHCNQMHIRRMHWNTLLLWLWDSFQMWTYQAECSLTRSRMLSKYPKNKTKMNRHKTVSCFFTPFSFLEFQLMGSLLAQNFYSGASLKSLHITTTLLATKILSTKTAEKLPHKQTRLFSFLTCMHQSSCL